jgi:hypothetical protein
MRHNGTMSAPELAPRFPIGGIILVWALAAVAAAAVGIFAPADLRFSWLLIALGGTLVVSFAVQLREGRADGFTARVGMSVLGGLLAMGLVGLGFALASIVPN